MTIIVLLIISLLLNPLSSQAAGSSYAVIDGETGRLLMGENEHYPLPIASLTKMWTAYTFLDIQPDDQDTVISHQAATAEGSSIYLEAGQTRSTRDLLYGLMLRSGNDAAQALAEHAGGSLEGFVYLMNEKARSHGLEQTYFTNPSGLHAEHHLSSAYDTAKMLYFGMKNPEFRKIASTVNYPFETEQGKNSWQNKHRLVLSEPTAIAGKTGFTKAAGRTLATYFEKDGKSVIVVTLNNGNDWQVHKQLSQQVFSEYQLSTAVKKGRYQVFPHMTAKLDQTVKLLVNKEEKKLLSNVLQIPQTDGKQKKGYWSIYLGTAPIKTIAVDIETEK
ncbi:MULTISPECIES: D-alanyl-D-alanine carboxypeptidase family protein [unclassified Sporosarcina]|uniref:D-alanyl-D-alanine carboxypeptidase family protein n=1 Tax=unclassified Sporosarcina TaxID=2647733 RepID=UPI000C16421F|nr:MULTISPECIES: D-alanyl-D-alanine carboxypeptidase family protein [unclassified Sporosarcina]PID18307.1 D-alanyl-D-alanine carboxypeptidase [Sporosarcina sp. P35]